MATKVQVRFRRGLLFAAFTRDGDLRRACKLVGYSLSSFYRLERLVQTEGYLALVGTEYMRRVAVTRLSPLVEAAVIIYATKHPLHGPTKVRRGLKAQGIQVSVNGVRSVFRRYELNNHFAERERFRHSRRMDLPNRDRAWRKAASECERWRPPFGSRRNQPRGAEVVEQELPF